MPLCFPASKYVLKVNKINTRKRCEICSKLTIKKLEGRRRCLSGMFIVNFEHVSLLFPLFLLLTLNRQILAGLCNYSKVVQRCPRGLGTERVTRRYSSKNVLKNFAKFRGKHLIGSVFCNEICLQPVKLIKSKLWLTCFPVNFLNFWRAPIL